MATILEFLQQLGRVTQRNLLDIEHHRGHTLDERLGQSDSEGTGGGQRETGDADLPTGQETLVQQEHSVTQGTGQQQDVDLTVQVGHVVIQDVGAYGVQDVGGAPELGSPLEADPDVVLGQREPDVVGEVSPVAVQLVLVTREYADDLGETGQSQQHFGRVDHSRLEHLQEVHHQPDSQVTHVPCHETSELHGM